MQRPEALLRIRAFRLLPIQSEHAQGERMRAGSVWGPAILSTSIWFESMKSFSLQTSLKESLVTIIGSWFVHMNSRFLYLSGVIESQKLPRLGSSPG